MITKEEFITEMKDAMDIESDISDDMVLADIDEWDSLAMLNVLAIFHDNDVDIEVEDLEECTKVSDILARAGL
jgi:acyl carrier protein